MPRFISTAIGNVEVDETWAAADRAAQERAVMCACMQFAPGSSVHPDEWHKAFHECGGVGQITTPIPAGHGIGMPVVFQIRKTKA